MPDVASIVATISAIKNSLDVAKAVKEADYDLDKAILKEKIAVLVDSLFEAKLQAGDILGLIQDKDNKISELEGLLSFKSKLIRDNGRYYEIDEGGNKIDDPFCPKCWEVQKIPVHLKHIEELLYRRPNCDNGFGPTPSSWNQSSSQEPYYW